MTYNLCPAVNGAKILVEEPSGWEPQEPGYHDPPTIDNLLDLDEGRTESVVRFAYDPDNETIKLHYIDAPHRLESLTIHDLFNELHRRLLEEDHPGDVTPATELDKLHHDYTDLMS